MLDYLLEKIEENPANLYLKTTIYEDKNINYLFYLIIKQNLNEIKLLQQKYPLEVEKGLEKIKESLEDNFHVFLLNKETADNNFQSLQFLNENGFEKILKNFFENFASFSSKTPMNIDILYFILKNTNLNKSLFERNDLSALGYFLKDHKLKEWATIENIKYIFDNISPTSISLENKEKLITQIFYILENKEVVSFVDTQISDKKKKSFILALAKNKYVSSDTFIEIYEKNKHLLNTELNIFQELVKENNANSIIKLITKNPEKLYETEWGDEDNNIFIMCLTEDRIDFNIERYGIEKYEKYKINEIKMFNFIIDLESKMKRSYLGKDNSESAQIFERITAEKYIYSNVKIFRKFMEETLKVYSLEEFPDNFFRKLFKDTQDFEIIKDAMKLPCGENYLHLINNQNRKMFEEYIKTEKDVKKCEKIFGYAFLKERQEHPSEEMLNAFKICIEKGIDILNSQHRGTTYLNLIYERLEKYKTCFEFRNEKNQKKVNEIELIVEGKIKNLLKDVNKQDFDEKSLISPLKYARKELILGLLDEKLINIETGLEIAEKHEQREQLIAIVSKLQLDNVLKNNAIVDQKAKKRL